MERRLGHDLRNVRVHHDERAARSAEEMHANAYTTGDDIVFGPGRYDPGTTAGQKLLAHELTHVVQQARGATGGAASSPHAAESEARDNAQGMNQPFGVRESVPRGSIQRDDKDGGSGGSKPKRGRDQKAQDIVDAANDTKKTPDMGTRARNLVWSIIKTYYPADEKKVTDVIFDSGQPGLETETLSNGEKTTAKIRVGKYFIENVDKFARRVLQVGHELQHVGQARAGGMAGPKNQDEREFLAFEWEAREPAKEGTGRVPDKMRRTLIDCALGYFNCLTEQKRKGYAARKDALLKLRETVNGKNRDPATEPPSGCKRCNEATEKKKADAGDAKRQATDDTALASLAGDTEIESAEAEEG